MFVCSELVPKDTELAVYIVMNAILIVSVTSNIRFDSNYTIIVKANIQVGKYSNIGLLK